MGEEPTLKDINDNVLTLTGTIEMWTQEMDDRVLSLEMWQATSKERWAGHSETHRQLGIKSWATGAFNALATAIMGVFLWLVKGD